MGRTLKSEGSKILKLNYYQSIIIIINNNYLIDSYKLNYSSNSLVLHYL